MTAATLTAADAGADLGTALRRLADRFDGITSPEELREFTDEAAALVRRTRGRLRTLTRRAEPKPAAAAEPEPTVIRIGPDGPLETRPPAPAERPAAPPVAEARPQPPGPADPAQAVTAEPPPMRPAPPALQAAPAATTPPRRHPRPRPVAAALTVALLAVAAVCGAWTTTTRTTARAARATGRGLRRAGRWFRRLAANRTAGSRT